MPNDSLPYYTLRGEQLYTLFLIVAEALVRTGKSLTRNGILSGSALTDAAVLALYLPGIDVKDPNHEQTPRELVKESLNLYHAMGLLEMDVTIKEARQLTQEGMRIADLAISDEVAGRAAFATHVVRLPFIEAAAGGEAGLRTAFPDASAEQIEAARSIAEVFPQMPSNGDAVYTSALSEMDSVGVKTPFEATNTDAPPAFEPFSPAHDSCESSIATEDNAVGTAFVRNPDTESSTFDDFVPFEDDNISETRSTSVPLPMNTESNTIPEHESSFTQTSEMDESVMPASDQKSFMDETHAASFTQNSTMEEMVHFTPEQPSFAGENIALPVFPVGGDDAVLPSLGLGSMFAASNATKLPAAPTNSGGFGKLLGGTAPFPASPDVISTPSSPQDEKVSHPVQNVPASGIRPLPGGGFGGNAGENNPFSTKAPIYTGKPTGSMGQSGAPVIKVPGVPSGGFPIRPASPNEHQPGSDTASPTHRGFLVGKSLQNNGNEKSPPRGFLDGNNVDIITQRGFLNQQPPSIPERAASEREEAYLIVIDERNGKTTEIKRALVEDYQAKHQCTLNEALRALRDIYQGNDDAP